MVAGPSGHSSRRQPSPTGSITDYTNWLKNVEVHSRGCTLGDLLRDPQHKEPPRLLRLPKDLKRHVWGTLPV